MANESVVGDISRDVPRAFIAIELPDHVKKLISAHIERLKSVVTGGVKWVDPGIAHITLAFIGSVPDTRLSLLSRIVDTVASDFPSFGLNTGRLGAFPNTLCPRVLWLGLEDEAQVLMQLQGRLRNALADKEFPTEERAFKAHITLGRARGKASVPLKQNALNFPETDSQRFVVRELVLMSSVLTPQGPIHTPLHRGTLSLVTHRR